MRFYIFPRIINGEDKANPLERKTEKVFVRHAELVTNTEGGIPLETEATEDTLLADPTVEQIADTLALAEELISAALEDVT